jgi:putative transposase
VTAFIDQHRGRFGVEPICRTLDVSASAYYQRKTGTRSARSIEDERLLEVIRETQLANYEAYGYRRTWKALRRARETVPRYQVQRLMRAHGIQGAKRRGKPLHSLETVINLIAATSSSTGLKVYARLDNGSYPDKIKVPDDEIPAVNLHGNPFHPEWNYIIKPKR